MSITVYHLLVILLLAALMAILFGAGFAWGCRLSELDEPGPERRES